MILKTFRQVVNEENSTQDYVINALYARNHDSKMTLKLQEGFVK